MHGFKFLSLKRCSKKISWLLFEANREPLAFLQKISDSIRFPIGVSNQIYYAYLSSKMGT